MEMTTFKIIFTSIYRSTVTTTIYSNELASKIGFGIGIAAVDMPKAMAKAVEKYGGGCCFHHAWRLVYKLNKAGINAYWANVPEPSEERPDDQKSVVVYVTPEGERFVADPVEDIKASVKMEDFIGDECRWINNKGEIINNSRISLKEMARISDNTIVPGYLYIYPKPRPEDGEFSEYYSKSKIEKITCKE